ncbi:sirohydrochlorin chelatase [Neobacillus jeddahensis]|uniref:sirohydrochlorin chelatase n=1 Tax=Neobacillus jeddahensis TaxID=1461580 RepID=UPI00058F2979|nr:sirohydrochlorin chelatase [Neobacillus jeddahensis]
MKAILYIGHGTRSKKGANEVKAFVGKVMEQVDVPIQEVSFLELTEPSIAEGFRKCVQKGATEITVVPLFLLAAGHIKHDIPQALQKLQASFPEIHVVLKDPFGVQTRILDAIAELIKDSTGTIKREDQVLLVGRGSSDPSVLADFAQITVGLKERLALKDVSVCFLAAAEPRLKAGFEMVMEKAVGRVIVVPYLLFSGLLIAEVNQEIRKWQKLDRMVYCTDLLSSHKTIEAIVIDRATS